jgi:hypothetical protein
MEEILQNKASLVILNRIFQENGWTEYVFGLLVFGSSAFEEDSNYKDLDLLIILIDSQTVLPEELQSSENLRIFLKNFTFPRPVHVFCHTKKGILKLCNYQNQLIGNILNFGKITNISDPSHINTELEEFIKKAKNICFAHDQKKIHKQKKASDSNLLVFPQKGE